MNYVGKHRATTRRAPRHLALALALTAGLTLPLTHTAVSAHADSLTDALLKHDEPKPGDVRTSITSLKDKIKNATIDTVAPTTGTFTSGFEMRWGTFHDGMDIANSEGTPIYAAKDGIVIDAGPVSGYGNWIRIKHEDGTVTLYGHQNKNHVEKGETVKAGQYIADMGSQGFSTGSHLHFGVYKDGETAIDPHQWLIDNGIHDW